MATWENKVHTKDFYIHQGQTKKFTLTLKDENNIAKNITGYTYEMDIRKRIGSPVVLALDSDGGGIVLTALSGEASFTITAAQSAAFDFVEGVFDIKVTDASGGVTYLLKGRIFVTPRSTD